MESDGIRDSGQVDQATPDKNTSILPNSSSEKDRIENTDDLLKQINELKMQNELLKNLLKEKDEKFKSFRINPSDVYENLKYLQVSPLYSALLPDNCSG